MSTTSHTGLGTALITSFYLNFLLRDLPQKSYWGCSGLRPQYMNLGEMQFIHTSQSRKVTINSCHTMDESHRYNNEQKKVHAL